MSIQYINWQNAYCYKETMDFYKTFSRYCLRPWDVVRDKDYGELYLAAENEIHPNQRIWCWGGLGVWTASCRYPGWALKKRVTQGKPLRNLHCAASTAQLPQMPNKQGTDCAPGCRMSSLPELSFLWQWDVRSGACWLQTHPALLPCLLARRCCQLHLNADTRKVLASTACELGKF